MTTKSAAGLLALLVLVGCEDAVAPEGPFDLTVRGEQSLVGAYAGRAVHLALVDGEGSVAARNTTTIATEGTTAFNVGFPGALDAGVAYELFAWIDADAVGAGAPGSCDAVDPQWRRPISVSRRDQTVTFTADLSGTSPACDAFTVPFVFSGGPEFQNAHAGQDVVIRIRDVGTGAIRATGLASISATADPPFSFTYESTLVTGRSYEVDVWIDSNTGGGAPGVCDALPIDAQWRISIGTAGEDDMSYELMLDGPAMRPVCPFQI